MSNSPLLSHLLNWRLHVLVIIVSVLCELVGIVKIPIGIGTLVLLPLLYAFILALILNPNVVPPMDKVISKDNCKVATYAVILSVMPFIAKFGLGVGPKASEIIASGLALILQELGNVATALVALPVAVLVFNMGREAVGATHSIAREPNIALIADKYGLKSPEGIGVMGVYVMGTLFGAIYFSLMAGVVASWNLFDVRALAMACGIGSGSMMGACSTTLAEMLPEQSESITAFAASSNLLTYATGLFVSLFIALPFTNWMYRITRKIRGKSAAKETQLNTSDVSQETEQSPLSLSTSFILLVAICVVLLISNWVGQKVDPLSGLIGMVILYLCCVGGLLFRHFIPIGSVPAVAWTSIIAIIISLPAFPGSEFILQETGKLGVLQLITPVLAYAGFAISHMEVELFKRAGVKIAVIALLTFTGTFLGSAFIANILL